MFWSATLADFVITFYGLYSIFRSIEEPTFCGESVMLRPLCWLEMFLSQNRKIIKTHSCPCAIDPLHESFWFSIFIYLAASVLSIRLLK